jgi:phosphoribosylformylglycinamidine synthase
MTIAVHRIEVRPRSGAPDPRSDAAGREARSAGVRPAPDRVECTSVFLIEGDLADADVRRVAAELLADPVTEEATIGASPPRGDAVVEVHPRPGVMDPDAEAVERALAAMLGARAAVRTARRYDFHGVPASSARAIAQSAFASDLIHELHDAPYHPRAFPASGRRAGAVRDVPVRDLDADALRRLSRDAHLFLDLAEMQAIQAEYRRRGREPRDVELETLAQTWSEHCVHKTFKSAIRFTGALPEAARRPRHTVNADGSVTIDNLLAATVAAATHELIADGVDWCLSVFTDNSGVIAFDDEHAVCFKVETHNHPSALEPYGGAATGIGGCIRDVIGTGLGAKPIAATDVFCVARPDRWSREPGASSETKSLPAGCIHPRRLLRQVVAGVRDYGNRMGIPTINGAVWFHDDYVGNPLVFCGCVGVLPAWAVRGAARDGDLIVAIGGRTGRDGIHGATFSSAELTDAHGAEFGHAVQIGNAVTEKKLLDVIVRARDHEQGCLYHAITDCGAGGFSSAIGEMGESLGAEVHLDRAPLKYEGLSPTEVWISEAQERMVLAVPAESLEALRTLAAEHDVETCELGRFGVRDASGAAQLVLLDHGREIGRLAMTFLHDGRPAQTREARWSPGSGGAAGSAARAKGRVRLSLADTLLAVLADPNVASKRWIVQQYDHEVQGRSVIRPLVGPRGEGPGDAAVILPVRRSPRGLAIGCGLATGLHEDPYLMALAAIDECVRNLVCVGADPERIAILDNFCWPGCDDPDRLGALVRAAAGCYDGAKAYRTPFISGKDSLNNQFATEDGRTIRIPPTLLVSGFGIVSDVARAVTMDAKAAGSLLVAVGITDGALGGAHLHRVAGGAGDGHGSADPPRVDLERGPRLARRVHALIAKDLVRSAHDPSDGGLLAAAAEMAIAGDLGLRLDLLALRGAESLDPRAACFAETPSRYLLEVRRSDLAAIDAILRGEPWSIVGSFDDSGALTVAGTDVDLTIAELRDAWTRTLDWE